MIRNYFDRIFILLCLVSSFAHAETRIEVEEVTVTGGAEAIKTIPGSATWIDETSLENFEHVDIHQVLSEAPGVYVREEDGYGLRPNIGMRGAPAERSQKIAIMEDGILIGPAPYSAPAAYYFPNISRISAVEVFKGPVSIGYGPHTVGGALNLVTTPIPEYGRQEINLGYGSDAFRRLHANMGDTSGQWGWLIEGFTMATDGFKSLDTGGDTGFERNDFNLKLSYESAEDTRYDHKVVLRLGAGNEHSNETYLGLTNEDFEANPYRRYAASQLDEMNWDHNQIHLDYHIEFSDNLNMTTRTYRNHFDRAWERFDNFRNNRESNDPFDNAVFLIDDVLDNPNGLGESRYYDLLTGAANASGLEQEKIDVVTNDRRYLSQGVEWILRPKFDTASFNHQMTLGVRFHQDEVERLHSIKAYNMTNGQLIFDDITRTPRVNNKGQTDAWALFVKDEINDKDWRYTLGLRAEIIDSELTDFLNPSFSNERSETVLIPGIGAYYQWSDRLGFLAGVNRGFSPNAPGPIDPSLDTDIEPELSVNWEAGFRYQTEDFNAESILFFSDYSNLLGRCRASDPDCIAGQEFNGGEVEIAGLEANLTQVWRFASANVPFKLIYTYTESAFQSDFQSGFSQWGNVEQGDELPYLPEHVLRADVGYEQGDWQLGLAAKYSSEMRETAGRGSVPESEKIDDQFTMDFVANHFFNDALKFQFKVQNLFDEVSLISRRPIGARPNRPRSVEIGVQYLIE